MKSLLVRVTRLATVLVAVAFSPVRAQLVEFRATIAATQETTGSVSPATGWAVLLYDVATNKFDLTVSLTGLDNTITASHLHEAAPGVAGPVVTPLGAEAAYVRSGSTITGTFTDVTYAGTPLTLLRNGTYINFHSASYPGGEIRGQLIAQPVKLAALLRAPTGSASSAYGAALITYDPGTNKISTRVHVYNFANTLTNSHYHEAPPGANGPVVHGLGGASVYTQTGTAYGAVFANQTYGGDPWKLLAGGAYLNVHSNVNPGGEIRGQVHVSTTADPGRLVNVASRGWVGPGEQVLVTGFVISGSDPVRVLLTARGPSLTALGVTGALANPLLRLHDSAGRAIVTNDDFGTGFAAADLPATGFAPTAAAESALLLVLPPGVYTAVVSGADGGTGVALAEVYEVPAGGPGQALVASPALHGSGGWRALAGWSGAVALRTGPRVLLATLAP
jgi:hypothetical protein